MSFPLHLQVCWKSKTLHQFRLNVFKSRLLCDALVKKREIPELLPPTPLPNSMDTGEFQGKVIQKMSHMGEQGSSMDTHLHLQISIKFVLDIPHALL